MVRSAGGLGGLGPVKPSRRGARRPRRAGATDAGGAVRAKAWAQDTARAQDLPERVEDLSVITEVAVLLAGGRMPVASGPPDRLDAVGIEAIPSPDGPVDDDPGEDCADDGPLARRVQVRPLGPERAGAADEAVERRGA